MRRDQWDDAELSLITYHAGTRGMLILFRPESVDMISNRSKFQMHDRNTFRDYVLSSESKCILGTAFIIFLGNK